MDRYFLGGRQISDGVMVTGTEDPELYKSQRYGNFTYRLPVAPGKYRLRLLFAETFFGPHNRGKGGAGSRIFNVYYSGHHAVAQLRDLQRGGGRPRDREGVSRTDGRTRRAGSMSRFEPVLEYAVVQGIELTAEK